MTQVNHTVVRGETLSTIARKYNTTTVNIASLNDLSPNSGLYIGQVLIVKNKTLNGNAPVSRASSPYIVDVTGMGLQSNSDNTIFITWSFKTPKTDHYVIEWGYSTADGRWYNGSSDTVQNDIYGNIPKESTYSLPSNGISARARIKPVSTTWKDSNGNEFYHYTGQWTNWVVYSSKNNPPGIPPSPTVTLDNYTMTITNDNLDVVELNADEIEYQIVQSDNWVFNTGVSKILFGKASYTVTITPSFKYKVRARAKRGSVYGGWSEFTDNNESLPSPPYGIDEIEALSDTSVRLSWTKIGSAKTYSIEYAEKDIYFDSSNGTTVIDGVTTTKYIVTGLAKGKKYYFRLKCVNDSGSSAWCEPSSVIIGTKPDPPSTWSDRTIAIIGEKVTLSWLHNSVDGSDQKEAEIQLEINGQVTSHKVYLDDNEKPIDTFELDTSKYIDGTKVYWKVRTKGVVEEFSDWSIQRLVEVYAPATLSLNILNIDSEPVNTILSFPFIINAIPGPPSQSPISYSVSVKAKESYITNTPFGDKNIGAGEEIYSDIFNYDKELKLELTAGDIDLENGINYDVEVRVTMNSGLSVDATSSFDVSWTDISSIPNAEIIFNDDRLTASLRPYCERYEDLYRVVELRNGKYYVKNSELPGGFQNAVSVDGARTTNGKQVYKDETDRLFCIYESGKVVQVTDVLLSVYRRTHDGKFVELAKHVNGDSNTFITDPHPSLDFARYRIVSTDKATGAVSYMDISPKSFNEESIVIQWADTWSNFLIDDTNIEDVEYSGGSLIKLPYNISMSESNTPDISTINYIGREHPVSYYGTALGVSVDVTSEFDKNDNDMLYALRRLSVYMGDAYVRLPSGVGYWANIKVSYDRNYDSLIVPVTFNIIRVDGGI